MSNILLSDPPETDIVEVLNIIVNFFFAFVEMLMLSFLLYIGKKTYQINKFNDKFMIAMIFFLISSTTGKYYFILLKYNIATIFFFIFNAVEKFYDEKDPKY